MDKSSFCNTTEKEEENILSAWMCFKIVPIHSHHTFLRKNCFHSYRHYIIQFFTSSKRLKMSLQSHHLYGYFVYTPKWRDPKTNIVLKVKLFDPLGIQVFVPLKRDSTIFSSFVPSDGVYYLPNCFAPSITMATGPWPAVCIVISSVAMATGAGWGQAGPFMGVSLDPRQDRVRRASARRLSSSVMRGGRFLRGSRDSLSPPRFSASRWKWTPLSPSLL